MPNSINTNTSASYAVYNINRAAARQLESLKRISSGSRLNNTFDDSGSMSMSVRNGSALIRLDAVDSNIVNALSFLQSQASGLHQIGEALGRMSEMATQMVDPTKTSSDLDSYLAEFNALREQMGTILESKYNGIDLFKYLGPGTSLSLYLDDAGTQSLSVSQSDFSLNSGWSSLLGNTKPYAGTPGATDTVANLVDETVWGNSSFRLMMDDLASLSATNAAQQTRLMSALDGLRNNRVTLSQANSRMSDTDVAAESTTMSRSTILLQSGTDVLTKANETDRVLLKILGA